MRPRHGLALGGVQNAGAGIKIAIIDTGIDPTHPAFQDASLAMPAGYPICSGTDCAFTSNKVIVARSYVRLAAAGTDPQNPAADSRPDDYSPRDRIGHGTAVASCAAGMPVMSPAGLTLTGVAPKAYLGNYKIFGSPEVNETTPDDPIIMALEDALNDHMDIASLSLGSPALTGPLDSGATCGNAPGVPCDVLAMAVENAVKAGMLVVIAAGNSAIGQSINAPAFGTVQSPGNAPSAIEVGATTNSHFLSEGVEVPGDDVPDNMQRIAGVFGDAPIPPGAAGAVLLDVTELGRRWTRMLGAAGGIAQRRVRADRKWGLQFPGQSRQCRGCGRGRYDLLPGGFVGADCAYWTIFYCQACDPDFESRRRGVEIVPRTYGVYRSGGD